MKHKILTMVLGALLIMPCISHADEIEIPLTVMGEASLMPGDNPLDDPEQSEPTPIRPRDFQAIIIYHDLTVLKHNHSIPLAHAIVVNAATGAIVLNRDFFTSFTEQITDSGVYIIYIQCIQGTWQGQFIVQ